MSREPATDLGIADTRALDRLLRALAVLVGEDVRARYGDAVAGYVETSINEHVAQALRPAPTGPDPEPPPPEPCDNCWVSYDACTKRVLSGRKACCGECGYRTTHGQDAWEAWDRRQRRASSSDTTPIGRDAKP